MAAYAEANGETIEFLRKENDMLRSLLEEVSAYNKRINNDLWKLRAKISASPTAVVGPAETDVYKTWNADATCEIEVSEPFSTLKETELPAEYAGKRVRIVHMVADQPDICLYNR